ncbi:MAG TPA: MFS transporter [Longimicrobiales bacterium]
MRTLLTGNLLWLGIISLLNDAASEMIFPLLPVFLVQTLGAGPVFLGLVEGVAETTSSLVKLVGGWLSDRVRRRKALVGWGYAVAAGARPLIALASAPWHVLAVRFVDRVGKGVRTAPRDALLADSVVPERRGTAFGLHRAADHAGAVLGPLLASGLLLLAPGRVRLVFAVAAVPGILSVLILLWRVREVAPLAAGPTGGRRSARAAGAPATSAVASAGEGTAWSDAAGGSESSGSDAVGSTGLGEGAAAGSAEPGEGAAAGGAEPGESVAAGGAEPGESVAAGNTESDESDATTGTERGANDAAALAGAEGAGGAAGFRAFLAAVAVFTLGNASDAFLLLRAQQLGVAVPALPLLWGAFHVSKMLWSVPGGMLADRIGARRAILAGWAVYAAIYAGYGAADSAWHGWALFLAYGLFYGLTEAPEKALVARLAPAARRATGFGAFHSVVGLTALPASVLFGLVWEAFGAAAAFGMGAALGLAAALVLAVAVPADAPRPAARPGVPA